MTVERVVADMDRQFPNPKLVCTVCGGEAKGNWGSLQTGWRKCCGYMMRLVTGNEPKVTA